MLAITRLANSSAARPAAPLVRGSFRVRNGINKRLQFRVQRLDRGRIKLFKSKFGAAGRLLHADAQRVAPRIV